MSNPHQSPGRIDYQETADITEVHAAVQREKPEPSADVTPMPMWLTGVCAAALVWAGLYFGIFNGGLSGNVFNEYQSSPAVLFPLPEKAGGQRPRPRRAADTGATGQDGFQRDLRLLPPGQRYGRARSISSALQIGICEWRREAADRHHSQGNSGTANGRGQAVPRHRADAAVGGAIALAEEDRRSAQLRSPGMG